MNEEKELSTLEEIKAFSDPYRLKIISTIREFNRPATVKEIADKINETPAKVHYHVKKLEKVDILKLVDTKEINGIIAKYYSPTAQRFTLKHNDENEEINKVFLTETQRIIHNLYENSKNLFIEQITKNKKVEQDKPDLVSSNNLYLSIEEINELNSLINRFTSKKLTNEQKQSLTRYHLFSVYFPIEEDKNKKE